MHASKRFVTINFDCQICIHLSYLLLQQMNEIVCAILLNGILSNRNYLCVHQVNINVTQRGMELILKSQKNPQIKSNKFL